MYNSSWTPQTYVGGLEKTLAFMKSPEYVPGKPLPDNLATVTPDTTADGASVSTAVCLFFSSPLLLSSSLLPCSLLSLSRLYLLLLKTTSDSFNAMALTEAQVELQKLKESTAVKIEDLTQELQFVSSSTLASSLLTLLHTYFMHLLTRHS